MTKVNFTAGLLILLLFVLSNCTTAIIDEESTTITEEVTYADDIEQIMFNHCVTCHGGAAPFAGLSLETYNAVKESTENGNLLSRIENVSNPMPPAGLMSADDRAKVAKWAADGFN